MTNNGYFLFFVAMAALFLVGACADKEADQATTAEIPLANEDEDEVESAAALFSVKPLDFGNVKVGTVSPRTKWIIKNNTSTRTLTITDFQGDTSGKTPKKARGGTCGSLPWVLGPKSECYINMVFRPPSEGEISREFTYSVNFGTGIRIRTAKGFGIREQTQNGIRVQPSSLTIQPDQPGKPVSIENIGGTNVNLTNIQIIDADAEACLAVTQTNNCPSSLGPGDDCTVTVSCQIPCQIISNNIVDLRITSSAGNASARVTCQ